MNKKLQDSMQKAAPDLAGKIIQKKVKLKGNKETSKCQKEQTLKIWARK